MLLVLVLLQAARSYGCFSIVAGRNASTDGYVLVGHNEDDTAPQIVHHRKIPRKTHAPGEMVALRNGGRLPQVGRTWAYIWSEMPGMSFSDSYINEWGVAVTSDNCPSREANAEITDGGIGYMLRRLVAERARNAREGVLLAGKLVERFAYIDSGRTYIICDPDEGWLFCVVNGKHWLARKVADDEVAMVANTYTVRRVNLSDKARFLASPDIVEYAVKRGWYDPKKDGPFDFAAAYANPKAAKNPSNSGRQWAGLKYVASKPIKPGIDLPFSVVPPKKLAPGDIMKILGPITCDVTCPLCSGATQTSFVAQLRRGMPLDIGIVYWVCLASPRTSFYIPFHFGISDFPAGFAAGSQQRPSAELYNRVVRSPFRADPRRAFWTFSNFYNKVDSAGPATIELVQSHARRIEKSAFAKQGPLEQTARREYSKNKETAIKTLADYSDGIFLSSLEAMKQVISQR